MGTVPPRPLKPVQNDDSPNEDRTGYGWGLTTQEAADALISAFGGNQQYVMTANGPMRITDQWGSIRVGYIEPGGLIGDSSSGIEPCSYEEL